MKLLNKRYYRVGRNYPTNYIDTITVDFRSGYMVISQQGLHQSNICINKKGQQVLYKELKEMLEK